MCDKVVRYWKKKDHSSLSMKRLLSLMSETLWFKSYQLGENLGMSMKLSDTTRSSFPPELTDYREHLTCFQIVDWADNRENLIYTSDFCFLGAEGQNSEQ